MIVISEGSKAVFWRINNYSNKLPQWVGFIKESDPLIFIMIEKITSASLSFHWIIKWSNNKKVIGLNENLWS